MSESKNRKMQIRKKMSLIEIKKELSSISSIQLLDIIEADSDEVIYYRKQMEPMHEFDYPKIAVTPFIHDDNQIIEWIFKQIPVLQDDAVWIMPYGNYGMWWIKIKVVDCISFVTYLWKNEEELCFIDVKSNQCYEVYWIEDELCFIDVKSNQCYEVYSVKNEYCIMSKQLE